MSPSARQILSAGRRALRQALADLVESPYLPIPPDDRDLFLVAFPKSGVNWLKWLMINANLLLSGDRREVNFFNSSDFIADIHSVRRVAPARELQLGPTVSAPGCRCFTSHAPWTRRYRKVIYLVRDPRHVMASYQAHLASRGNWQGSLEALVEDPRFGIEAWMAHVGGWLDNVDATARFTLLRYEDLTARPAEELIRLYGLLGWRLDGAMAAEAAARASPERMRALEAESNAGHPRLSEAEFVRRGEMTGPRQALAEATRARIEASAGQLMRRLGYLEAR
jgi:hypothetical protein